MTKAERFWSKIEPGAPDECWSHLFLGTPADNSADMVAKGRSPRTVGERNGRTKLTDSQITQLRGLARRGVPNRSLATMFATPMSTIQNIVKGNRRALGD